MSTTISILGGVGLFLLGMTVMTGGLKALAGSALRTVLSRRQGHRSAATGVMNKATCTKVT
jgi:Na+/phosphate symporter